MATVTAHGQNALAGSAPPSPAGPLDDREASLPAPPMVAGTRLRQVLQFNQRQIEYAFRARRQLGEVFGARGVIPGRLVFTSHADHVRSLFTCSPPAARRS